MNVFVLCTGRCGSVTFSRACSHITNYTVGHETRCARIGKGRFAYPDGHIEVDNRLAWLIGRLEETYGDNAMYVHLVRDPDEVARSHNRAWHLPLALNRAYADGILMSRGRDEATCRDMVDTVNANIRLFLRGKTRTMTVHLDRAADDFRAFWEWIDAEGDMDAALAEWAHVYNAAADAYRMQWAPVRNLIRLVRRLPHFLRYG